VSRFGVDIESAIDRGETVSEPTQARAAGEVRAAYAVVADLDRERSLALGHRD